VNRQEKYGPVTNFFVFKWGNKYSAKYVNRLYNSICKFYKNKFTFTCITDDNKEINNNIKIIDYDTFDTFDYPKDRVFTREKLVLFKKFNRGLNIWLDLDILIHNDITEIIEEETTKPVFIWNYWTYTKELMKHQYGRGGQCFVNSSFVKWKDNQGEHIYDSLVDKSKYAFYTYKSLDKYLFYQHYRKNHLLFWKEGLFYNYNFSKTYNKSAVCCIFNTSHLKDNSAYELHEANDWVREIWSSYELDKVINN